MLWHVICIILVTINILAKISRFRHGKHHQAANECSSNVRIVSKSTTAMTAWTSCSATNKNITNVILLFLQFMTASLEMIKVTANSTRQKNKLPAKCQNIQTEKIVKCESIRRVDNSKLASKWQRRIKRERKKEK